MSWEFADAKWYYGFGRAVHRLKVPGGWLVSSQTYSVRGQPMSSRAAGRVRPEVEYCAISLVFCADPDAEWQIVSPTEDQPPSSPQALEIRMMNEQVHTPGLSTPLPVPGGWLVSAFAVRARMVMVSRMDRWEILGESPLVFLPDPSHEWAGA